MKRPLLRALMRPSSFRCFHTYLLYFQKPYLTPSPSSVLHAVAPLGADLKLNDTTATLSDESPLVWRNQSKELGKNGHGFTVCARALLRRSSQNSSQISRLRLVVQTPS